MPAASGGGTVPSPASGHASVQEAQQGSPPRPAPGRDRHGGDRRGRPDPLLDLPGDHLGPARDPQDQGRPRELDAEPGAVGDRLRVQLGDEPGLPATRRRSLHRLREAAPASAEAKKALSRPGRYHLVEGNLRSRRSASGTERGPSASSCASTPRPEPATRSCGATSPPTWRGGSPGATSGRSSAVTSSPASCGKLPAPWFLRRTEDGTSFASTRRRSTRMPTSTASGSPDLRRYPHPDRSR